MRPHNRTHTHIYINGKSFRLKSINGCLAFRNELVIYQHKHDTYISSDYIHYVPGVFWLYCYLYICRYILIQFTIYIRLIVCYAAITDIRDVNSRNFQNREIPINLGRAKIPEKRQIPRNCVVY